MDSGVSQVRRPPWLKRNLRTERRFFELQRNVRSKGLSTVCESACCPNRTECWNSGTLTVMILGDICTRACRFCAVSTGHPRPVDTREPEKVARLVKEIGAAYVVLTSVDRDDLPDGGAAHWAETIIKVKAEDIETEALVPDFGGDRAALDRVFDAAPSVLGHNVETVRSLQDVVRPQADYGRSLAVLKRAADAGMVTKSGFMVGFGERMNEIEATLADLAKAGVKLVTIGQYLQPREGLLPVDRFWSPDEFSEMTTCGESMALKVLAGPMVRSSYRAHAFSQDTSRQTT